MTLPLDIVEDYEKIKRQYDLHLFRYGVKLPKLDTTHGLSLVYLYRQMGNLVSQKDILDFVLALKPEVSPDIQPRHLKYQGWHLLLSGKSNDIMPAEGLYLDRTGAVQIAEAGEKLPNGHFYLVSCTAPSPDFMFKKRRGSLDHSSWDAMLASCDHRCVVCKEKKPNLEKGHKDPRLGQGLDNIIPMCSDCNNWASNDFIFDDTGRIVALASPRLVMKSDLSVQLLIYDQLRKSKDIGGGVA